MTKVKQSSNQRSLAEYCQSFSNLNVYKTDKKGYALNQPILLLSVIDLISQNVIKDEKIYISDDLIEWRSLISYRKDIFPIDLFKYGVIAFPIGLTDLSSIYYFGEALNGLDGKILKIDISEYNR
jgi:putative restriction endonuclease